MVKDVNAKFWPRIKPEYMEFFPPGAPDEAWNKYEEDQEREIKKKIDSYEITTKLDGFIQLVNLCLESNSRPDNPHNHHPAHLWGWGDLAKMQSFHEDFKYYDIIMAMDFIHPSDLRLNTILQILTSFQQDDIKPLDELSKARIRKEYRLYNLKHYKHLDYYKEVFGNEFNR